MPNEARIRIPAPLADRVHRFALAENRAFDNAAQRLLTIGLAPSDKGNDLSTLNGFVTTIERATKLAAELAEAAALHKRQLRDQPELCGFISGLEMSFIEFNRKTGEALAGLPERHRA
jgi:hypothetical protein